MENRKARLLMQVPARAVGDICYYKLTNMRRLCFVGDVSGVEKHAMTQMQNKKSILELRGRLWSKKNAK